jgi:hypothetical protein
MPSSNLYPYKREGYYIYKRKDKYDTWEAEKKYSGGYRKRAVFHSLQEAIIWIESLT